jgi:ankyrin repeat protein
VQPTTHTRIKGPMMALACILLASDCASAQFTGLAPPSTPLLGAAASGDTAKVKDLLKAGTNPNEGCFLGIRPVGFSLMMQSREMFQAFREAGVDFASRCDPGTTALMWAAYSTDGSIDFAEAILKAGVDVNAIDKNGDTALMWALRSGNLAMARRLEGAGASRDVPVRAAVQKAIALLQASAPQFVRVSGCISCHHQNLPAMAMRLAAERGIVFDAKLADEQVKSVMAVWNSLREGMEKGTAKVPNPPIVASYSLVGLDASKYRADETTKAMVGMITQLQGADGGWRSEIRRPPLESSDFTATALSLRSLQLYGGDPQRVSRAAAWLLKQEPKTLEDRVMQLFGLSWAQADQTAIQERARKLLAEQRVEGGWAQAGNLDADAYSTGQALVALNTAGALKPSDGTHQSAVDFLLRTQRPDGSWLVRSRAFHIQPYKESGFPHGKDQWISAAGTSWAAMALSLAAEPGRP